MQEKSEYEYLNLKSEVSKWEKLEDATEFSKYSKITVKSLYLEVGRYEFYIEGES